MLYGKFGKVVETNSIVCCCCGTSDDHGFHFGTLDTNIQKFLTCRSGYNHPIGTSGLDLVN